MSKYDEVERKHLVAIAVIDGETFTMFYRDMSIEQVNDAFETGYINMVADEHGIDLDPDENSYTPDVVFHSETAISQAGSFGF